MSLEVRNLSFQYIPGRPILRNMSFTAGEGKLLSVLGPNGVGKSTLFRCMLGLQGGYQGSITLNGRDVQAYGTRELARTIAYIPQSHYPTFNYSVLDMVLMGTTAQSSGFSPPGREQERLALEALDHVARQLGRGLALLVDLLNPERIVIGSIYARCEGLLRDGMLRALAQEALPTSLAACRILPAALGDRIGDYAALAIAMAGAEQA
mgnify:CR=1 FL=1